VLTHAFLATSNPIQPVLNVFHPLLKLFGWVLAGLYAIWPNYGFAIAGLTIIIMLALTPITVKSTRSMIAMQRLQPELKKLQAKYKGPENRELLNQEMMKLYKENGTSPFGACLPPLLQMPFLIVLYSLIRDLSKTTATNSEYLPSGSQMHQALVASHGHMPWWFGMDLSTSPLSGHGFPGILPYLGLIAIAVFLQYYQMKQMNSRNPQAAAANPQMQTMQKIFPIAFGAIYLKVPAGATIYMVVSSAMRILTQEVMFRSGMVTAVVAEREIGSAKDEKKEEKKELKPPPTKPTKKASTATDGTALAKGTVPPKKNPSSSAKTNGNGRNPSRKTTNGKAASSDDEEPQGPKPHPRSRSKRTRKAR
jgi:YidC/Oxa1 family membrane protein insertase